MSNPTITRALRTTTTWTAELPFRAYFRQFGEQDEVIQLDDAYLGIRIFRLTGDEESVGAVLLSQGGATTPVSHLVSTTDRDLLVFLEQYAPELRPEKVVHLLDTRVIKADEDYPAWCRTPILSDVLDDRDWDSTEERDEVTCADCGGAYDEYRFEQDEEGRLERAGTAAYDRAVDRHIEAQRLGGEL